MVPIIIETRPRHLQDSQGEVDEGERSKLRMTPVSR